MVIRHYIIILDFILTPVHNIVACLVSKCIYYMICNNHITYFVSSRSSLVASSKALIQLTLLKGLTPTTKTLCMYTFL